VNQPSLLPEDPPPADDNEGAITIGAVCDLLKADHPSISISKIRYLEDQRLITPKRTAGGYRLYSPLEVERLRTILRLQRDEFLPLRVIRQELASGRTEDDIATSAPAADDSPARPRRRPGLAEPGAGAVYSLEDVVDDTRADPKLVQELQDHGVIAGQQRGGTVWYDDTEREIVRAVVELARYGVAGRNLRVFRTSADREAALLQQILAPALRSRNPERRREAVDALENLATVTTHLKHLLLLRDLRKLVA